MNKEEIRKLIEKSDSGELNDHEKALLERLIEEGVIDINDFGELTEINAAIDRIAVPATGKGLDEKFYAFLEETKSKQGRKSFFNIFWADEAMARNPLFLRMGIAASLLIAGFFIGFLTHYLGNRSQMNRFTNEIREMNEMMMIALIEKPSATDRLKAVSIVNRLEDVNSQVVDALLNTLNYDDNVNVRLAAVDALLNYAKYEKVRKGMVEAIVRQDSPLVQVALAEAMVALQEKSSVGNLKRLLSRQNLNEDVKEKINESIKEII